MTYYCRDVERFHSKFHLTSLSPGKAALLPEDLHEFRLAFLWEEFQEYVDSCKTGDLGTAIDSLIDLVYVTCGTALLAGFTPEGFENVVNRAINSTQGLAQGPFIDDRLADEEFHSSPTFLSPVVNATFTATLASYIRAYQHAHEWKSVAGIAFSLASIYLYCLTGAVAMGVTEECWQELWDDVQRANMSKERVLREEDSKRGSTYDVRKPAGWVPPHTDEILMKYL